MKTYNPPERHCEMCGRLIIIHNPREYVFKRQDNRSGSPTFHKTLFFCGNTCLTKFEKAYPGRKRYGGG